MSEHGSCSCGQVEFEVKLDDKTHILCHCRTCQKLSGGAASLNQIIPKDDLKILKGDLKTYTYHGDSGNLVNCYFCPNCGTHIYHHQTVMGPKIVVHSILLDNSRDWKPAAEIYGKDRLPWVKEVAHTFELTPPQ